MTRPGVCSTLPAAIAFTLLDCAPGRYSPNRKIPPQLSERFCRKGFWNFRTSRLRTGEKGSSRQPLARTFLQGQGTGIASETIVPAALPSPYQIIPMPSSTQKVKPEKKMTVLRRKK